MAEKIYLNIDDIPVRYHTLGCKRTIERLIKEKNFPPGKKTSPRKRTWSNIEIESWLDEREDDQT